MNYAGALANSNPGLLQPWDSNPERYHSRTLKVFAKLVGFLSLEVHLFVGWA